MIRLKRVGRRNDPSFRLVVMEKQKSAKSGRVVEHLGSYDARADKPQLASERIKYWLSVGAKPSDTAHNLLVESKIITGKKIDVAARPKKEEESGAPKAETEKIEEQTPTQEPAAVEGAVSVDGEKSKISSTV